MNRFRFGTFDVISDIKKAFLQISIDDKDRDSLRFLWFENGDPDDLTIYRHKYPILLPSDFIVVQKMIMHNHKTLSHCGIQTLMSILREEFWILKSRRTIRKAIKTCTVCKRFDAKHPEVQAAPLPEDRLRDSATFDTTGIDLEGP
ncbi:hypothetical protein AVEN_160736-1 [Araneus ventricosus]|uniref:Integrase zinc-binding domain-containing protein n=1 Tax=Araneus ventricosus TaxID=182803 RepID=A0A4Y2G9M1_ARAVE|nr:hypothetical protein AVEN_160736-1 [Araneus ventricosus]